ncbi:MAG: hypothetical protein RLP44_08925 [Aggregatilineales bacterium]
MRRVQRTLLIMAFVALPVFIVFAQPPPGEPPPPAATEDIPPMENGNPPDSNQPPPGVATQPSIAATDAGPGSVQSQPVITQTPAVIPDAVEATAEVVDTEIGANIDIIALLIPIRADLDIMANLTLGEGQRPVGWSNLTSTDIADPNLLLLSRLDLEILVGNLMGANTRPEGWFGAVASTQYAIARDIRHDLELLADTMFTDQPNGRPDGWNGDDPLFRCGRATQALVELLEINELFSIEIDPTAADFCLQVEIAVSQFAELNLLANPVLNGSLLQNPAAVGSATINSQFAVAFLDRGASQRVGVIPNTSGITPVARSAAQFSNMMLVRGQDFEVFVDYQFTSVTQDEFDDLPDVDSIGASPFCSAEWCSG